MLQKYWNKKKKTCSRKRAREEGEGLRVLASHLGAPLACSANVNYNSLRWDIVCSPSCKVSRVIAGPPFGASPSPVSCLMCRMKLQREARVGESARNMAPRVSTVQLGSMCGGGKTSVNVSYRRLALILCVTFLEKTTRNFGA